MCADNPDLIQHTPEELTSLRAQGKELTQMKAQKLQLEAELRAQKLRLEAEIQLLKAQIP